MKDKEELPFSYVFGMIVIMTALYLSRHELPPMDWRDGVMFFFLGIILWICFRRSGRDSLLDAHGHEQPDKSIAFRLGKSLKRVLHNRRGNTAARNKVR